MRLNGTKSRNGFKAAVAACTLLIALASASCEQKVESLGVNLALEKRTLSNGMNVILVEDHTVPVVSYQTWFRVGSVDERPGITGISHLFEHLMFKGTPRYPAKQFFQQLEAHGAEVNAFTTRDYTTYYENFVPDLLERVIDMESDRMANLTLSDEVLGSERMVVLEERRLRTENSPDGKMQEALWGLSFSRHPYNWPVIGYPQDLLQLTTPVIQDYFQSHYQPANATLVIVGDINPQTTYALIKKYYEGIPARPRPKREIAEEPVQNEEHRLVMHDRVASQRFALAYHVTAADNDDSYALDVLSNILFEGTSSRAYRRLVDEKDILLGISGSNYTPTYPGLFIINGNMKGSLPAADAEKGLNELIQEVQEKGVTPEEIKIAVRQLTVQLVDSVRTPYGLGQLIGTVQTIFGDPKRFAEDLSKYLKVTAGDVQRVAQKYLIPNNRSIVTMIPGENGKGGGK
ncbi:MAG: M16 family metallopeptidase [Bdellovibrionota bacterium]